MIQTLCKETIKAALPDSYRYLLWSAGERKGLFNPEAEAKKARKKHKYTETEDKLG